jgi:PAS domain S-box-containing protein
LVAGAQGGVVLVNSDRRFVYANPSACHLLGHTLEQLRDHEVLDRSRFGADASALAGFIADAGDSAVDGSVRAGRAGRRLAA